MILAVAGVSIFLMTFAIPKRTADDDADATPPAADSTRAPDLRVPSRAPCAPLPAREGLYL